MNNLQLKAKIGLSFAAVLLLLSAVVALYHSALVGVVSEFNGLLTTEVEIGHLAKNIESLMLQCRRNEKDFLLNKDIRYKKELKENVVRLTGKAKEVSKLAKQAGYNAIEKKATQIVNLANDYKTAFDKVAGNWTTMGLDHKSGLQGEFENSANSLSAMIQEHAIDNLAEALLTMRRSEKDYVRTQGEQEKTEFLKAYAVYKSLLVESKCNQVAKEIQKKGLAKYRKWFDDYFSADDAVYQLDIYEAINARAFKMEKAIKTVQIPNIEALSLKIRQHEKDYLLRHDKIYVDQFTDALQSIQNQISASAILPEHVAKLETVLQGYESSFSELVVIYDDVIETLEKMQITVNKIEPEIIGIVKQIGKLEREKAAATSKNAFARNKVTLSLSLIVVVLGIFLAVIIVRAITGPILKAVRFAEGMALGDFSNSLNFKHNDEIGVLCKALNKVSESTGGILRQITNDVVKLSSASNEMTNIAQKMQSGSEQTSMKTQSVAAATDEMSSNMNSVAAATEQASVNVKSVSSTTNDLLSSVVSISTFTQDVSAIAHNAVDLTHNSSEEVNKLQQAAEEIGEITEVITAISDKTNLLALNATIEAARAGEAGKGFTVVAGEIKALANQTAKATQHIRSKIKEMQNSTDGTMNEIRKISEIINKVDGLVNTIAKEVREQSKRTNDIATNIGQVALGISEVSTNVAHTSTVSAEIASDIAEVSQVIGELTSSSSMVNGSAEELSNIAENLKKMTGKFKISADAKTETS